MDTCRCSCTRGFGLDEAACRSATLMFTDLFVAAAVAAAVGWFGLGMDPCEGWSCSPAATLVWRVFLVPLRPRPPRRSISKSVEP